MSPLWISVFNILDIPDSEKTPVALSLLEVIRPQSKEIQLLKAEIARLKNRPGRPNLTPGKIGFSEKKSSSKKNSHLNQVKLKRLKFMML